MYTTEILGKSLDRAKQIRTLTVRFTSGEIEFDKDFKFNVSTDFETMKKTVKQYITQIETAELQQVDIVEGEVDLSDVISTGTESAITVDRIDAEIYLEKYLEFEQIMRHVDLGIIELGNALVTSKRDALI